MQKCQLQLHINSNINNILMYLYIIYTTYYKYLSNNSICLKEGRESTILLSIFPLYNNYQNDKTQILFCYPTHIRTHLHFSLPLCNVFPLSKELNLHPQVSANPFSLHPPATPVFLRQTGLKQTFPLGGPAQVAPSAWNVPASPPHS